METISHEITQSTHAEELSKGERFEFGENWSRFLTHLKDERIDAAVGSLKQMLEVETLEGKTFLDIGCGSGLFSLAAKKMGAEVYSFDFDPKSVACAKMLKERYFPNDSNWIIQEGSALDPAYLKALPKFDIVYSWGVLHHTGDMWNALDNASIPVSDNGTLFIAIYNDTGTQSVRWLTIKKAYNRLPATLQHPFALAVNVPGIAKDSLKFLLKRQFINYCRSWFEVNPGRGMSKWHDMIDWVGGLPYEVATPDQILQFYKKRGFTLVNLKCGLVGLGCSEFVFKKSPIV